MTTVEFAGNHRSAWKDPRYRDSLRALGALPGVKRIGLGYVRQVPHGKPVGGVRIVRADLGSVLVQCFSNEGFCEARLYGEDVPRIAACAAALPNAIATVDVEDEAVAGTNEVVPGDALAGLIRTAVAESLAGMTESAVQAVLEGGVEAAVCRSVADAMRGILERIEEMGQRLARAADDAAGAVHVASDLEHRLNELSLWHAPRRSTEGSGVPAAADPALAGGERMTVFDYIRVRGYPRPPKEILSALGMRMRRGAEAAGFVYAGTGRKALKHPVLYLRRMDADIRIACEVGCEVRTTLAAWLAEHGVVVDLSARRFAGQKCKALALENGVAFLPWEGSRTATEFPVAFLEEHKEELLAFIASVRGDRAVAVPAMEEAILEDGGELVAEATAKMPAPAPAQRMTLKAFLEGQGVSPLSAPAMRRMGRDVRRVALREGYDYGDATGPALHPVRILEAFVRSARRLAEEEKRAGDASWSAANGAPPRRPALKPARGRQPAWGGKGHGEEDDEWPWRRPGFASLA